MDFLKQIDKLIQQLVLDGDFETEFRPPITGCASADDQFFKQLKSVTHPDHMLPEDLLPGARSVIAFFLPYGTKVIESNMRAKGVSREWALAYVETNKLITAICLEVKKMFQTKKINVAWEEPTYSFNSKILMSTWSHRHAAYAAGLGTFGLNNLFITDAGCAGRVGSFVVDAEMEPTPKPDQEKCLYKRGYQCEECITLCPTGALTKEGFDRHRCYKWLLKWDKYFSDLPLTDVCGKCSLGRCSATGLCK